jgi:hypothetical protein
MKKVSRSLFLKYQIPFHPWIYFCVFLVSNTILSFFPLSIGFKLWAGVLGLLLPLTLAFWTLLESCFSPRPWQFTERDPFLKDWIPPLWLWTLYIFILVFSRFYKLTTLPFWPLGDEGIMITLGIDQARLWKWQLLLGEIRFEAFYVWLLGIYFKFLEPSLFSIRLLPALVSLATPMAAYWASKFFFPRSYAFLLSCLIAFSFWEFTLTRLCLLLILIPLFQFLCFGLLGRFLVSNQAQSKWKNLLLLGIIASAGFYTWTNWIAVWLCLLVVLIGDRLGRPSLQPAFQLVFVILSGLLAFPLIQARLAWGGSVHIRSLLTFSILKPFYNYFKGIFWDGSAGFPYGSNWGGCMNPLLDSLVLLGGIHLVRSYSKRFIGGLGACLFFTFLPGALTNNFEFYRILPLMPFLMVLAVLGLVALAGEFPKFWRWVMIVLLGLGSVLLDMDNYVFHYCDSKRVPISQQWRNLEYFHAYQILKHQNEQAGPLFVFSEFNMDYDDKTLNIACYPFDALQNPALSHTKPLWAALLNNINYAPFLKKRFPQMLYELLGTNAPITGSHPALALFLIPVGSIPPDTLNEWIEVDKVYRTVNLNTKNKNPTQSWGEFLSQFVSLKDNFKNDLFLTSIFWEKTAFFNLLIENKPAAAQAYENAIHLGYPAAHLYYKLGLTLKAMGKISEGQKLMEKAEKLNKKSL